MTGRDPRRWRGWVALAAGLLVLAFVRLRVGIDAYVDLHRWLQGVGVPEAVRDLDDTALLILAAIAGARWAAGRGGTWTALGLRGSPWIGLWFGGLAGAPMFVQAIVGADQLAFRAEMLEGMLLAPFVEELFFRGLLVAVPARLGSAPFWPLAIGAGLVFGAMHVRWDQPFDGGSLAVLATTGAGGIWYAWLVRTLHWNLWATVVLHTVMNGGWLLAGVPGGALGDAWSNVGRALTIALGTVLALRWSRTRAA